MDDNCPSSLSEGSRSCFLGLMITTCWLQIFGRKRRRRSRSTISFSRRSGSNWPVGLVLTYISRNSTQPVESEINIDSPTDTWDNQWEVPETYSRNPTNIGSKLPR